ncbi:unnamed protein product, partial [Mesorhabditis belari]|uniref:DM13 domain-containing protein n=1 Tax=Mesorhabditis belari TaxID=2138241 RepID=A0AAF3EZ33_9BILA
MKILTFIFGYCILEIQSLFTPHFREFLATEFGEKEAKLLERVDLEEKGSYGGREKAEDKIRNQPVIFVHGISSTANKFHPIKHLFQLNGYTNADIYATTWGDPQRNVIVLSVECEYVKQIRTFIRAIHLYTKRRVDVIGFSLGSVISRKAIYGGYCDGEELGKPITNMVDTFVSVAGPNKGSAMCDSFSNIDLCNPNNGVSCESSLLYELNTVGSRYEALNSFAIYSSTDEKIGDMCCGAKCGSLESSNREFGDYKMNHDKLLLATAKLQLDLVVKHRPRAPQPSRKATPKKTPITTTPTVTPIITTTIAQTQKITVVSASENKENERHEPASDLEADGFKTSTVISYTITGAAILIAWLLIFTLIMHIIRNRKPKYQKLDVLNQFSIPQINDGKAAFLLTNGASLADYRWIGLYNQCTKEPVPLISLDGLDAPREEIISPIKGKNKHISSGPVRILNCNTILIPDFRFVEKMEKPDSYFYVGIGLFPNKIEGQKKARVLGFEGNEPLENYHGDDVMIRLPAGLRTFDVDFLAIYNEAEREYFGFVTLPSVLVPPCAE